ncbi:NDR1/HIN1-like protein 13 [Asparagus officinalis]|uniref:NDR1/HIN1-like protein 13 n=1 Tax=Asparagus officinalis TaxID=4686 RepID=UPI00098E0184|nr:NDR1/HIN1-like protein 13 [Asparagus officinalis]
MAEESPLGEAIPHPPAPRCQTVARPRLLPQAQTTARYRLKARRSAARSRRRLLLLLCFWIHSHLPSLRVLCASRLGSLTILPPSRPSSPSPLRLSQFNFTKSGSLNSRLDLSVTARNPNKKVEFVYDLVTVAVSSNGVDIGDGTFPAFVHEAKNTSILKTVVTSKGGSVDSTALPDLKKKSSLPLEIDLETRAGVKFGSFKTKKIGIKVSCDGFSVAVPNKKAGTPATPDVSCKVKLRIKIWKWTF